MYGNIGCLLRDNGKYFSSKGSNSKETDQKNFSKYLEDAREDIYEISYEGLQSDVMRKMYDIATGKVPLIKGIGKNIEKMIANDPLLQGGKGWHRSYCREDGSFYLGNEVKNPIDYKTFIDLIEKGEVVNPDWAIREEDLPPLDILNNQPEYLFIRKGQKIGIFDENGNVISKEVYENL